MLNLLEVGHGSTTHGSKDSQLHDVDVQESVASYRTFTLAKLQEEDGR